MLGRLIGLFALLVFLLPVPVAKAQAPAPEALSAAKELLETMHYKEQVSAIHAKALEQGGTCDGPPGPRGGDASGIFAAYFRDLDGNKISALHFARG